MNVSCNGAADGKLSIDSFSGTGTPTFYLKKDAGAFVATTEAAIEAAVYGPGTYVIKVTYADGNNPPGSGVCEKTETEIITQTDVVTLSASHLNVSCNGAADGKLSIDSFSGTGTPSFYLKIGAGAFVATTEAAIEAANYGPGTYVIKISYPDGSTGVCEKTETETITQPDAVTLSASHLNVSCNGAADGKLSIDSFSGTGTPSFYLKKDAGAFVATTEAAIEAAVYGPGTYVIKVTYPDGNNPPGSGICEKTETETITQPDAVTLSASHINVSCNGAADGKLSIDSFSGTGIPTFYLKKDAGAFAATTEVAIEAAVYGPGTYVIKVAYPDGNNPPGSGVCEKTETETITQPDAVTLSASHLNVSCNGAADGKLSIDSFSGTGTPTFYLKKDAGAFASTTEAAIEAAVYGPGTYVIKVTYPDGNNPPGSGVCEKTETETITQPDAVTLSTSHTNVSCNGDGNGTLSIDSFSGTGTPSFFLKIGAGAFVATTEAAIEGGSYAPGTYTIKVIYPDGNNPPGVGVCNSAEEEEIIQPSSVTLSASHMNVSCNGAADGKLSVDSFSGTGTPSFYLKKDAGAFAATTEAAIEAANYEPGTYVIKVTYPDGNNPPGSGVCEKTETETITQPDVVTLSASHTNVSCNAAADGKLSVDSFSGTGTPTFYLKIGAGAFVATTEAAIEAANYGPETYVIKVTYPDGNNPPGSGVCEKTETETIIQPDAVTLSASHTNVSCNGAANGKLSIDSFSGTGTASFYLKTGAGAFVATTEAAIEAATYGPNTYVIKVTYPDGNNPPSSGVCEKTETETISEPPALSCSLTQPAIVNCSTSGNTVSGTVSGGTSAYSCSASFDAAGTAAGWSASCNIVGNAITVTYTAGSVASTVLTVEITDANGCKSTCSLTLSCNGGKACTPGFWKNHAEVWNAQNDFVVNNMPGTLTNPVTKGGTFITTSSFYAYFNIPVTKDISNKAGLTMLDVTALGGGGCKALARHGVSALLGAAAFPAEYPFPAGSTDFASLYTLIRNAFLNGNCDALAATLANINNLDGPFCSALSQLAQVEQLAITTTSTIASFDAYPVPFKDQFTIKYNFDYKSDVKIEVFNSQGALVFTMNDTDSYLNKEVIIKIDSVLEQQQVYVVKLTTRKGSSTKTIMSSSE